eukprot:2028380-Lingulodinium_polyedra.AAC.1
MWAPSAQSEFYDDLTGFSLEGDLVRLAREEEMDYLVRQLDIWELVDWDFAVERMGGKAPIPVRWVDIDKG